MIVLLPLFSSSVMSNSLRPHGLQYSRFSCLSLSPGLCWNSCPLSSGCIVLYNRFLFFLPSFISLIPSFIHFLRCFYFNILLKSVLDVSVFSPLLMMLNQYIGASEEKFLIIHDTFQRLKTQPNLEIALGKLFTDFGT